MIGVNNSVVADFETTKDARVWFWDMCYINDYRHESGVSIASFLSNILYNKFSCINYVYFHNLGFDGEFIISVLLSVGFKSILYNEDPKGKCFKLLSSSKGTLYSIEVFIPDEENSFRGVKFLDSAKIIPVSVEDIAVKCNMSIKKLEIDYDKERREEYVPTEEEIQYCRNDTEIVARILNKAISSGMRGITIGSCALNEFKLFLKYPELRGVSGSRGIDIRNKFPKLDKEVDRIIRYSYKGGLIYLNDKFKNCLLSDGIILDINSMYPYFLCINPVPYGIPVEFEGKYEYDSTYPLYIQEVCMTGRLKEDGVPCLSSRGDDTYLDGEILEEFKMLVLTATSYELEMVLDNYDIEEIDYIRGLKFRSMPGNDPYKNIFTSYVVKYYSIKSGINTESGEVNEVDRLIAKLMLNNLIGKFATKSEKGTVIIDDKTQSRHWDESYDTGYEPFSYPAVPAFVNSAARKYLVECIRKSKDRFIYCDTDSVHLIGKEVPSWATIGKNLGVFKLEAEFYRARYLKQKCYAYSVRSDLGDTDIIKHSGASKRVLKSIKFEEFYQGSVKKNLRKKRVRGGCILEEVEFKL